MQPIKLSWVIVLVLFTEQGNSKNEMIFGTWQIHLSWGREIAPGSCLLKAVQRSISISGVKNLTWCGRVTGGFCVESGENKQRKARLPYFKFFLPASLCCSIKPDAFSKVSWCQVCANPKAFSLLSPRLLSLMGGGDTDCYRNGISGLRKQLLLGKRVFKRRYLKKEKMRD